MAHRNIPQFKYYHKVISIVKTDIFRVEQQWQQFNSTSDLKHIDTLLQALESKLYDFHIFASVRSTTKPIGFRWYCFESLLRYGNHFGNSDLVHPLSNQVKYVKELGQIIPINTEASANLTTTIRDNILLSRDKFQQITKEIMWLHFIVKGQSAMFVVIRQNLLYYI